MSAFRPEVYIHGVYMYTPKIYTSGLKAEILYGSSSDHYLQSNVHKLPPSHPPWFTFHKFLMLMRNNLLLSVTFGSKKATPGQNW